MKRRKRANGLGSVYYDDRLDRYIGLITVKGGKRKRFHGPKGDRRPLAQVGVEEQMRPFVNNRNADADRDLGAAVQAYLDASAGLSPTTVALYKTAAKHIIGDPGDPKAKPPRKAKAADPIAREKLIDLKPTDIKDFYARLETGATMKQKVHVLLHRILEEAVDLEVITRNPASKVPKPKAPEPEVKIWKPEEAQAFLKAVREHRLYALFLLALTSTMGPAELFGLRREDVNLGEGFVTVNRNLVSAGGVLSEKSTKTTKRRRRIALPPTTISALRERYAIALAEGHAGSRYVFTSDEGGPIRIDNFRRRVWKPLIEKAGVPFISLYGLRHTANTLMGYLGIPIAVAQQRMGHSTPRLALTVYSHVYDSADAEAADRIEAFLTPQSPVSNA